MQKESVGSKRPRRAEEAAATPTGETRGVWLPLLALVAGVLAILPPYVDAFGELDVEQRVEFADHVVPGVAVLVIAVLGYLLMRSPDPSELLLLMGGAAITLAGLWMVATHLPLVSQARDGVYQWGVVLWHSVPGFVLLLIGVIWAIRFWGTEPEDGAASGR